MMGRIRFSGALLGLLALVTVASGCGGGGGPAPVKTPAEQQTTAPVPSGGESVNVYFLVGETVAPVTRPVAGEGGATEALEELLEGPSQEDEENGFSTAIPDGTVLNSYTVEGGTATADFSRRLAEYGGGSAMVQAIISQITETVLSNDPGVTAVAITVDGVPSGESLQP